MSNEEDVEEFLDNVWDHTKNPILIGFDIPRDLPKDVVEHIIKIGQHAAAGDTVTSEQLLDEGIKKWGADFFLIMLQISGLTRNKILTDLQPVAKELGKNVPREAKTLPKTPLWPYARAYLIERFGIVIQPMCQITPEFLSSLNIATWPSWIRQEQAKRGGHAGEQKLALALKSAGIPFEPDKITQPLCPDVQVLGESFDVVVPSVDDPKICFKSTIHTSNPGQYGSSKDVGDMKRAIEKFTVEYGEDRPIVMALIDGVGFKFAKSSLRGVLDASDEFCQFNTLWKAIVVASYLMSDDGLKIFLTDEDFEKYDTFLNEYGYDEAKRLHSSPKKGVKIGNAIFERVKPGPYDVKKEYLQSTICE